MIVKLKCVESGWFHSATSGLEYDALLNKKGIYVILDDDGYFSFIDTAEIAAGKWEIVQC